MYFGCVLSEGTSLEKVKQLIAEQLAERFAEREREVQADKVNNGKDGPYTHIAEDGRIMTGLTVNGFFHGTVTEKFLDGREYVGLFIAGKKDGDGVLTFKSVRWSVNKNITKLYTLPQTWKAGERVDGGKELLVLKNGNFFFGIIGDTWWLGEFYWGSHKDGESFDGRLLVTNG